DAGLADREIDLRVMGAEIESLYGGGYPTAAGGFITGVLLWTFFYHHSHDPAVLVWAAVLHLAQLARLAVLIAFQRSGDARTRPALWLRRYRLALFASGVAWGIAPLLFLPHGDLAATLMLMLVLLGMAVGGIAAIATDRASVWLWLVPLALPLPFALASDGEPIFLVLAGLAAVFLALSLRSTLAQNKVLSTALRARFENAALVERLREQVGLTAQASRDKSRFLAAASHDLRQPLHALSMFGAALEKRLAHSVEQPLIFNMMRSIEALDKSFGAMLDISRLDAHVIEPHVQSFPIRDVFRRLQMNFGGLAEEAGLQLRFKPAAKVVRSDPQLLERVLANLVQNALRYCRNGGVIVAAREWKGAVNIEVWDTGIGIPDDELGKIFDEFYQVANPERDRAKGLGMGLAIVKRLNLLLGHTLSVHSRVGRGTLCRVRIEGTGLESLEEFTVGAETVPPDITAGGTVLVIDDEEAIRAGVGELLSQWGYAVHGAATIAEACDVARRHEGQIDIVISDLRLRADEDGILAIERVRQTCGVKVPAVLVTGDTSREQVLRAHESGHIVMFKPVQPKELINVLRRFR
ncbi:MAG TPA: ATP-binding protein, partial [Caldimonas sp.]